MPAERQRRPNRKAHPAVHPRHGKTPATPETGPGSADSGQGNGGARDQWDETRPQKTSRTGQAPSMNPADIAGQSPSAIDQLTRGLGLVAAGSDPMIERRAYNDPVTGEQRI